MYYKKKESKFKLFLKSINILRIFKNWYYTKSESKYVKLYMEHDYITSKPKKYKNINEFLNSKEFKKQFYKIINIGKSKKLEINIQFSSPFIRMLDKFYETYFFLFHYNQWRVHTKSKFDLFKFFRKKKVEKIARKFNLKEKKEMALFYGIIDSDWNVYDRDTLEEPIFNTKNVTYSKIPFMEK